MGWGTIRFGSFAAARAFLRGEPIVAEPSVIDLGVIKANVPSVATVLLRNLSNKEVGITAEGRLRLRCDVHDAGDSFCGQHGDNRIECPAR